MESTISQSWSSFDLIKIKRKRKSRVKLTVEKQKCFFPPGFRETSSLRKVL